MFLQKVASLQFYETLTLYLNTYDDKYFDYFRDFSE